MVCVCVICLFTACGKSDAGESETVNARNNDNLNAVIGCLCEPRDMDASDSDIAVTADLRDVEVIRQMVCQAQDGEKQKEMAETLQIFMPEQGEAFKWSKGCYLSSTVIPYYNVEENGMAIEYHVVMLSEDLQEKQILQFTAINHNCVVASVLPMENYMEEPFEESPEDKFLFLFNAGGLALSPDNQLYARDPKKYQVIGDYYHALDYENLAVSYADVVDPEHLIWVDFQG